MKRSRNAVAVVVPISDKRRAIELADGAVAEVTSDGALELKDKEGRLLVRYRDGNAEIAAPSGDLILSARTGRVVVESALDVELVAARDVIHRAARNVEIASGAGAPQLTIESKKTTIAGDKLRFEGTDVEIAANSLMTAARAVATTAEHIAISAHKYELVANRLVEKTQDAFRDVKDLAQTRVGRARTVVASIFTLHARRTVMASKEETSIDGRKILLG